MVTTSSQIQQPISTNVSAEELLERLSERISGTASVSDTEQAQAASGPSFPFSTDFEPRRPNSLEEAGLTETEVEALLLKYLYNTGSASGAEISVQLRLHFKLIEPILRCLKEDQLIVHKNVSSLYDYVNEITDLGRDRAEYHVQRSSYCSAAPVPFEQYVESVKAQSLLAHKPTREGLESAFSDMLLGSSLMSQLGRAIHAGRGMFIHGTPGNGKTTIAERITNVFGDHIWIPYAVKVADEYIQLFDPCSHVVVPQSTEQPEGTVRAAELDSHGYDERWVCIQRPTVVVGGELTMENLELSKNQASGISEAPIQMKSNCGTLLIDDFGRQRMSTHELLNRWIIPLEKRFDILTLENGQKFTVPFDQFVVFSTNLEPSELVDEAFLRRIPYKIEVKDPTEQQFRELFLRTASENDLECTDDAVSHLIERHYRAANREMRFCHPRDLLRQLDTFCTFEGQPRVVSVEAIDAVVESYFGVMEFGN